MIPLARCAHWIAVLALAGGAWGCAERISPEEEVRAVIVAAEEAAEDRSVSRLMSLAARDFKDGDGRSADELARYVRGYFVANQSIRLLTRIASIDVPADDVASARITVAMVGQDAEASGSWDLAFDVYDFDVDLRRIDGDWKVVHADWRSPGR